MSTNYGGINYVSETGYQYPFAHPNRLIKPILPHRSLNVNLNKLKFHFFTSSSNLD